MSPSRCSFPSADALPRISARACSSGTFRDAIDSRTQIRPPACGPPLCAPCVCHHARDSQGSVRVEPELERCVEDGRRNGRASAALLRAGPRHAVGPRSSRSSSPLAMCLDQMACGRASSDSLTHTVSSPTVLATSAGQLSSNVIDSRRAGLPCCSCTCPRVGAGREWPRLPPGPCAAALAAPLCASPARRPRGWGWVEEAPRSQSTRSTAGTAWARGSHRS